MVDAEKGLDEPLGILTIADLVVALGEAHDGDVAQLARPLPEAPAETELDELLERLRGEEQGLALVREADGRTIGLITLEDIVEQVVGDLPQNA